MFVDIELARKERDALHRAAAEPDGDSASSDEDGGGGPEGLPRYLFRALRPTEDPAQGLHPGDAAAACPPDEHVAGARGTQL
eukprot:gene2723-20744_t